MKHIYILATLLLTFGFTQNAAATTISLSPTTVSVTKGQTFTLTVNIDPAGVKVGATKAELSFPPAILEVSSFTFSDGWLQISESGYELLDNVNGKLIKTAGHRGGLSTPKSLGTVTFRAKESGQATIAVLSSSFSYNAQNQNTLTGTQGQATVTVASPTPVAAPAETTVKPTTTAKPKTTPTPAKKTVVPTTAAVVATTTATTTVDVSEATSTLETLVEATSEPAAVSEGVTGKMSLPTIILLGIVALVIAAFFLKRRLG